mgnify:CR=1 FL=1
MFCVLNCEKLISLKYFRFCQLATYHFNLFKCLSKSFTPISSIWNPPAQVPSEASRYHVVCGASEVRRWHWVPPSKLWQGSRAQPSENFGIFTCYFPPESMFGNKGQLFHQFIGNFKICILDIPSAPWPLATLAAGFCTLFATRKHFWQ